MKSDVKISSDEWLEIMSKLQNFHGLFNQIWKLGRPVFDSKIDTAAVGFDRDGNCIKFIFNPDFWASCSEEKKLFVICHEALHVWLNHGVRMKQLDPFVAQIANIAMDLAINHSLVNRFGFRRNMVDPQGDYCWVDTVFKEEKVSEEESSDWYYNKLLANGMDKIPDDLVMVDDHGEMLNGGEGEGESKSAGGKKISTKPTDFEDMIKEAVEGMGSNPTKEVSDYMTSRGEGALGNEYTVTRKFAKKPKWETVIRKWTLKAIKHKFLKIKRWGYTNQRLNSMPKNYIIKGDTRQMTQDKIKNKIRVAFFLDTSGSCIGLADRFFNAASSLPDDKFEVDLYCFDTQVYKTTLKSSKVYGGGGTSFDIIEDECQKIKSEKGVYPEAVFIITDGYGNDVHPEVPEKWHWFLSANYTNCIPETSKIYNLDDFE